MADTELAWDEYLEALLYSFSPVGYIIIHFMHLLLDNDYYVTRLCQKKINETSFKVALSVLELASPHIRMNPWILNIAEIECIEISRLTSTQSI